MTEINVGLIGYGMASRVFHAPFITTTPGLKLTKVFERQSSASKEDYPFVEIVRDIDQFLNDEKLDLIVVATPNSSHFELAKRALEAGKNVIVEKPFTITSAQAKELIDLANAKNLMLSVHQNRRWDGDFLTIQKILGAGLLGTLVEYEAHYDRFRNTVDNFELILHYDRLKVTLKSGMLVREPLPRYILQGTQGSFVKYGLDPQEEALNQGRKPTDPNWGVEPKSQWGRINTDLNELHFEGAIETTPGCYQAYYQNVAASLRGETKPTVRAEEAFNTTKLIELALQSSLEKRTIVFSVE